MKSKYKYLVLALATWTLIINFWAWSLLSPLGTRYADMLGLSPVKLSLLLATPVVIGSLGRIIYGIATDKYGGKRMFVATCLLTFIPVVALAFATSYNQLIPIAMLLGTGGATFVIGIPFVSAWFPARKRGLVLGIYSMGNAGTAVSSFFTPRFYDAIGRQQTFILVAVLLLLTAATMAWLAKDSPKWQPSSVPPKQHLLSAVKNRTTWDLSLVYAVTFGAFVAFGVYLPVLLRVSYGLTLTDAATRAAGFVLLATLARPVGGWFSDKLGGAKVVVLALVLIMALAAFVAFQPSLHVYTTIAYLSLAFSLGFGNGAVFALVGKLSKPEIMGSVAGIIGTAGGLGGFFPPLVLGFTYQRTHSYTPALVALSISAFIVLIYIRSRFKTTEYSVLVTKPL